MNKLRSRNSLVKNKKVAIICFILMFITIGFAALSATLGIVSNARIAKVKWDVHFENIDILSGSVETTSPALINESNPTLINFGVDFTAPGDYYEFEVDVVNAGTIDAKIDTITLDGISEEQSKYINYTYRYKDGASISEEHALQAGASERIAVRLEFKFDINPEDLPSEATEINLNFQIKYVQDRGEGQERKKSLLTKLKEANNWIVDDNLDFTNTTLAGTAGYYIRTGTESDSYPIMYYRGAVLNNNVIFADICWQVVRTTETGGIKLIYNGLPIEGNCLGEEPQIKSSTSSSISSFNFSTRSAAYIGYMYNTNYSERTSDEMLNSGLTSAEINVTNSNVKKEIDLWYKDNISTKGYTINLEDAVWCNDRKFLSESGIYLYYSSYDRIYNQQSNANHLVKDAEACSNQIDRFTVNDIIKGNGALTYPVGLLTADEVSLAGVGYVGHSQNSYLKNKDYTWTMTPNSFQKIAVVFAWSSSINIYGRVDNQAAIRPAVSLAFGTIYKSGNGTKENPYTIEEKIGSTEMTAQPNLPPEGLL